VATNARAGTVARRRRSEGAILGAPDRAIVGAADGFREGEREGWRDGFWLGFTEEFREGEAEGCRDGSCDGVALALNVGLLEGENEGTILGSTPVSSQYNVFVIESYAKSLAPSPSYPGTHSLQLA
jgi:hypothetical protein